MTRKLPVNIEFTCQHSNYGWHTPRKKNPTVRPELFTGAVTVWCCYCVMLLLCNAGYLSEWSRHCYVMSAQSHLYSYYHVGRFLSSMAKADIESHGLDWADCVTLLRFSLSNCQSSRPQFSFVDSEWKTDTYLSFFMRQSGNYSDNKGKSNYIVLFSWGIFYWSNSKCKKMESCILLCHIHCIHHTLSLFTL